MGSLAEITDATRISQLGGVVCAYCFYPLSGEPNDGKYHDNCRIRLEAIDTSFGTDHFHPNPNKCPLLLMFYTENEIALARIGIRVRPG